MNPEHSVESISPRLRCYLYVTAALTGAAILVVEILGAKMLAPYFGTSHFVWTAQIGVTLVALVAGYHWGGRLADRSPRLGRLYGSIVGAAVFLGFSVLVIEPLARVCLLPPLMFGSLIASAVLFFVPLAALAMVGPFCVRALAKSLGTVGGAMGRLTAVSTLGSGVGAVLSGYVLIPLLPNPMTMLLLAALLLALAAGYFLVAEKRTWPLYAIVGGAVLAFVASRMERESHVPGGVELHRANSNYGLLQVVETSGERSRFHKGPSRYYLNDLLIQNIYDPVGKRSLLMSTYMLHGLATGYTDDIQDVLAIGMGVGIVPMEFARGGARVDAVEINPALPPLAERFFDLDPGRVNVVIADGRQFLERCAKQYDTVVLDAFLGDSMPSHLLTREAFEAVRRVLKPEGTLVIHSFCSFRPGEDFLVTSLHRTLRAVFRSVAMHHDRSEPGIHSVFFVASQREPLLQERSPDWETIPASCRQYVRAAFAGIADTRRDSGIVLTDDYNPVDYYDSVNREAIRRIIVADTESL